MRIVVDLQAAQTPQSRNRGIGRSALSLLRAMLRQRGGHEILVMLNGAFEESIEPIRTTLRGLIDQRDIRIWHATFPEMPLANASDRHREIAQRVRAAFLASLEPDLVHVPSLFEPSTFAVTELPGASVEAFPFVTAVTLHDLIPHIYPDVYLADPLARADYRRKFEQLRHVDLLLAVSESSRQEALEHLGAAPDDVVTISSSVDDQFTPGAVPPEREAALRATWQLDRPFVLYTGGIDWRKNIEGLVRAWAALPVAVRDSHRLAIVCSISDGDRQRLQALANEAGVSQGDVVFTGFVPDEDLVDLYRLCKLFVFPSRHEGFGLPALEAMRCGAPVIGAGNSSIREVIGRPDAMFDAHSDASITQLMEKALVDAKYRASLAAHALEQARRFDWDHNARIAVEAMERVVNHRRRRPATGPVAGASLALVTPMPPQPSGIAQSSADLLPALARRYAVDLVLDQPEVDAAPAAAAHSQRDAQWLREHATHSNRILYQFGNSEYHEFEFDLIADRPGVVVLHDFFLSGIAAFREFQRNRPGLWPRLLFESHGWRPIVEQSRGAGLVDLTFRYPVNFDVLRRAKAVIVHSRHALRLARDWYGPVITERWKHVPLLRTPAPALDRDEVRRRLGIAPGTFVVCSFGYLVRTKLHERLLSAWTASALASQPDCRLVMVGHLGADDWSNGLRERANALGDNVEITGWVDKDRYEDWLAACDMAVQLRALSRGETSAAVLDCMNHGVATIANAEGSMAELDPGAVWLLPENFTDFELAEAMGRLWRDEGRRKRMGALAQQVVGALHAPQACADAYALCIEEAARQDSIGAARVLDELESLPDARFALAVRTALTGNQPLPQPARRLLIDITGWIGGFNALKGLPPLLLDILYEGVPGWRGDTIFRDQQGVWRHARKEVLRQIGADEGSLDDEVLELRHDDLWAAMPKDGEEPPAPPAQATRLGIAALRLPLMGEARLMWALIAGSHPQRRHRQWFVDVSELVVRDVGTGIQRVVKNYLLELVLNPPAFTAVVPVYATDTERGYRIARKFALRQAAVATADLEDDPPANPRAGDVFFGLDLQPHIVPAQAGYLRELAARGVKIAFTVYDLLPIRLPDCFVPGGAAGMERWVRVAASADMAICISQATADDLAQWIHEQGIDSSTRITAVHLGADLARSLPSTGRPADADELLSSMRRRPTFLMVGTVEPRKGHAEVLAAFEKLWEDGVDVGLVIVGRRGWLVDELASKLRSHPELGKRLFWAEGASDEFLLDVYAACCAVIAASRGEGFGLPLVEAAQHGVPVIARDLPVFREIAGAHAFYFADPSPAPFAARLREWLALWRDEAHPASSGMPWLTWRESAQQVSGLLASLTGQDV